MLEDTSEDIQAKKIIQETDIYRKVLEEKELTKKVELLITLKDQVVIESLDESKFTENQLKSSKYVELSDLRRTDIRGNSESSIRVQGNDTAA